MNSLLLATNLLIGWLWILLGFASGMVLGMFFHREDWLGGYSSLPRRMYRLAHISFFGLGAVNLLFWLTMRVHAPRTTTLALASAAFTLGALTMPACCFLMAHWPKARLCCAIPVLSLLAGGLMTLGLLFSELAKVE